LFNYIFKVRMCVSFRIGESKMIVSKLRDSKNIIYGTCEKNKKTMAFGLVGL